MTAARAPSWSLDGEPDIQELLVSAAGAANWMIVAPGNRRTVILPDPRTFDPARQDALANPVTVSITARRARGFAGYHGQNVFDRQCSREATNAFTLPSTFTAPR